MNREKALSAAIAAFVSLVVALGTLYTALHTEPQPAPPPQAVRERIAIDTSSDNYLYNGADLTVYSDDHTTAKFSVDGATGNVVDAGTLAVTGASTLTGAVTASGRATVGTLFNNTPSTLNITVTNGATVTPLYSYQKLTAAGAVGASLAAGTAGDRVCFINTGSNAITITDTSTTMLGSDSVLGQYDTLCVVSDGTNWIEVSRSNN